MGGRGSPWDDFRSPNDVHGRKYVTRRDQHGKGILPLSVFGLSHCPHLLFSCRLQWREFVHTISTPDIPILRLGQDMLWRSEDIWQPVHRRYL